MVKISIVVMIGIPGAGKTHFCSRLQEILNDDAYEIHIVSYDDVLGTDYKYPFKCAREHVYNIVKDIIQNISLSTEGIVHHLIIIDDNMYYKSMRYEYYKLTKQYCLSFIQIYLKVDLQIALVRNHNRNQKFQVPQDVMERMASKLEEPGNKSWELNSVTLNSNDQFEEKTLKILLKIIKKPLIVLDVPQKRGPVIKNKIQIIDLLLRKIVNEYIKNNKFDKNYLIQKKEIFTKVKNGSISIPDEISEHDLYQFLLGLF